MLLNMQIGNDATAMAEISDMTLLLAYNDFFSPILDEISSTNPSPMRV